MKILVLRTDKPVAELYLFDNQKKLAEIKWGAHRQLAETLNSKIEEILNLLSISYKDLGGVVVFKGPGSFTGLRIGISLANALAYSLDILIVAAGGTNWIESGIRKLQDGKNDKNALPEYGAMPNVTPAPKT